MSRLAEATPEWMRHPFYGLAATLVALFSTFYGGLSMGGNDAPTKSEHDLLAAEVGHLSEWRLEIERVRRRRGETDQCLIRTIDWLAADRVGREPQCQLTVTE